MAEISKKRKRREKRPNPPLSPLDKGIYIALLIIGVIAGMCIIGLHFDLRERLAFSDGALASNVQSLALLCSLPLMLFIPFSSLVFFSICFVVYGKPIFGNKKVEYGVYPWPTKLYPLFDPRKKLHPKSAEERRKIRKGLCLWLAALFICLVLFAEGIARRCSLYDKGEVRHYNCFNSVSAVYCIEDFESVKFRTYNMSKSSSWTYEMVLSRGEWKNCIFSAGDFYDRNTDIDIMLSIKEMFPDGMVKYHGAERVELIKSLSPEEMSKLRELFNQ